MKRTYILKCIVTVLAFVEVSGCFLSEPNVTPEITEWIQENAVPFTATEPGTDYEDLMPLKDIIGDARIVALGEATHGTSEFFTMKHRIVEFLVKEMDFNVFAIEASWSASNSINEYVHTGEGDPAELLRELYYGVWNTQEVLAMIKWMQSHNETPGTAPTVNFLGFDMNIPKKAMDNVINYLQKVDPDAVLYVIPLYADFRSMSTHTYHSRSQSVKDQCRKNVREVYDFLKNHQNAYEAASSPEEFAFALQSARICVQAEDVHSWRGFYDLRDQYMAENAGWLLEQAGPDAKMVIWAHNGHVRVDPTFGNAMGVHLREQYNDDVVVFGFLFYEGSFNAKATTESGKPGRVVVHQVGPPPKESYEYSFHSAGIPLFFLDLRGIQSGADWLFEPRLYRSIGAVYDESDALRFFGEAVLPDTFDVIIYIENTSPSHLL